MQVPGHEIASIKMAESPGLLDVESHVKEGREESSESGDGNEVEDVEPNVGTNEIEKNCAAMETTTTGDTPYVGMEFDCEEATYYFYNEYAKRVGFGIRKRFVRRSKIDNEVIGRTYVCSREGEKVQRKTDNPRPTTRLGCKAMMKVKRCFSGKWVVINFFEQHNHELNPKCIRCFQSHRKTGERKNNVIRNWRSQILMPNIVATVTQQAGGLENLQFTEKGWRNYFEGEHRESLSVGDAQTISDFFMHMQILNPGFFYAMELDEEQHLRNVFWADYRSRVAYAHFGDVVTFDTMYLTNKYTLKLAPFMGVNHHGQYVLLGCALVTDETKSSFLWVLKTWLTAMQGKPPNAIITDQDEALTAAIGVVFPEVRHRFCLWHIMRKVPEKLDAVCKENPGFMYKFEKCIYDSLTVDEFERRWKKLIEANNLNEHEWLQTLYEDRKQWVPVYLKDTFFAGMSASQRNETLSSFFDDYVTQKTSLKKFLNQYGLVLQRRYDEEERADFDTYHKTPDLKTGSPYEEQMASVYTLDIFKKFQDEVLQIPSCNVTHIQQEGDNSNYVVKELIMKANGKRGVKDFTVIWNHSKTTVSCMCRLFEFKGYLCRHTMVVLFAAGVYEIPSHYIVTRWTRNAKKMDVSDEDWNELHEHGIKLSAKCFSDLHLDSIKLCELGAMSKEKYKAAKLFLKEALEKVASGDTSSTSSGYNLNKGNEADKMVPELTVHDIQPINSIGQPCKRVKAEVENSAAKRKYTCSNCSKSGHNINKCKEAQFLRQILEKHNDVQENLN
ncbi:PREDICTED: protein FAR1-RELATED SEQUENCE 4-like [Nelumbo nucifera]|uniref:Protein FAR1-RELATED SEQUENCE n=1 Tax=Nelumbo nucifera TaxID=4432 RepID=A0A1U8B893_NELNU|nr:PREDICTED: protein FAR1-RELATED SEQUENCE 4-like [Nelumbo nucifera]XP_010277290.1 PREDICTED: protein FAR1-RELATED SEQUENCE 4-like [Nelumbo nucifera]XP_010277291.1 PREDICTED: protein FAR1-RELATED SEQUENCE 4-like [Nelumbo nucifera]XP_010277292.1 PREDICTED: protein FAR1-RELATED SEQUENCE 4-like [Nelumbo nucifera]XP_010277293.1 PREDICTED: protein FAR1-RELATED SEQUENCE 4-like [Nelumbo nucifera]XP_010277294.1 PREDICTED: protein FAR1-RELATED SEQUENCE 4-like [Nelumbo nucifera]